MCGTGVQSLNSPCIGGLVETLSTNNNATGAAPANRDILLFLGGDIASAIGDLSIAQNRHSFKDPIAGYFLRANINAIALNLAYMTIDDLYRATLVALQQQEGTSVEEARQQVYEAKATLDDNYQTLVKVYGDIHSVLKQAEGIKNRLKKRPGAVVNTSKGIDSSF